MTLTNEQVAQVCHEANTAYCAGIGDASAVSWAAAPAWQRESAVAGVQWRIANPTAPESAQHDAWLHDKEAAGWVYGPVKDATAKTHPCMVAYDKLPIEQRLKDRLFVAIVRALTSNAV
jgi:hypothetical protein